MMGIFEKREEEKDKMESKKSIFIKIKKRI
jgi:hypothetical protein